MPAVHRAVSNIILCQRCVQKRALEGAMDRAQQFQPPSSENWRESDPYAKSPQCPLALLRPSLHPYATVKAPQVLVVKVFVLTNAVVKAPRVLVVRRQMPW